MATLWNDILERFDKTSVVIQRPGLDLSTAVDFLNSLDGFVNSLRPKFEASEERTKALSVEQCYQCQQARDPSGQFTTVEEDDRTHGGKRLEIDTFYAILDNLSSALRARETVYIDICRKFLFLPLLTDNRSGDELIKQTDRRAVIYKDDLEPTFSAEVLQFSHYLQSCTCKDKSARGLLKMLQER
ncbi:unnamed protein product [Ixodes pacificus]